MVHILVVDDAGLNKTVCTYLNNCGIAALMALIPLVKG